jgi:hypothetical protein
MDSAFVTPVLKTKGIAMKITKYVKSVASIAFFAGALLGSVAQATPTLTGDSVNVSFFSTSFGPNNAAVVVGAGQEISFYGNYGIDIGDTYVRISMLNGPFCGFTCNGAAGQLVITGMDFSPTASILGISLVDGGMAPFNAAFTANSVSFSMPDITQNAGMFAQINFRLSDEVPEPGTLALLGLGLAGLVATRRHKLA